MSDEKKRNNLKMYIGIFFCACLFLYFHFGRAYLNNRSKDKALSIEEQNKKKEEVLNTKLFKKKVVDTTKREIKFAFQDSLNQINKRKNNDELDDAEKARLEEEKRRKLEEAEARTAEAKKLAEEKKEAQLKAVKIKTALDRMGKSKVIYRNKTPRESDYVIHEGAEIKTVLSHYAYAGSIQSHIRLFVEKDFWFNGRLLLPRGTLIIGEVTGKNMNALGLAQVKFNTIVFHNDVHVSCDAVAMSIQGMEGLKGILRSNKASKRLKQIALAALQAFQNGLFETRRDISGNDVAINSPRNASIAASAEGFRLLMNQLETEIQANTDFIILEEGEPCKLFFTKKCDVGAAIEKFKEGRV